MAKQQKIQKKATSRKPKSKKRNPAAQREEGLLEKAKRLSKQFHGVGTEVVELSAAERKPLPRYVTVVGSLDNLVYSPDRASKRSGYKWDHESGDRGPGKPRSKNRPLVVVDPRTRRPALVMHRSPMRLSPRKGLIG